jgi:quercetin dioxygenase-like cupin family protein
MLDTLEPVKLTPDREAAMKGRLLARVEASLGAPARDTNGLITIREDEGDWQPFMPKIRIKVLIREGESMTYLLRLEPGAMVPPHEHPQTEECVVLEGEARIGDLVVKAGDYHAAPAGHPHGLLRSDTGALLFLRGAAPSAKQVQWRNIDAYAPIVPEVLRNKVGRWKAPE